MSAVLISTRPPIHRRVVRLARIALLRFFIWDLETYIAVSVRAVEVYGEPESVLNNPTMDGFRSRLEALRCELATVETSA